MKGSFVGAMMLEQVRAARVRPHLLRLMRRRTEEELAHVRFRLEHFQAELHGYLKDVEAAIEKREAQQAKREKFVELMHQVLDAQRSLSERRVAVFQEKERVLAKRRKVQELERLQIQNQRRISELLLRTDPNSSHVEVEAGAVGLARRAQLEAISLTLEALDMQREGYQELAMDHIRGLHEDAKRREEEIGWSRALCERALEGFKGLAEKCGERSQKVMERALVRKHSVRLLREGLEATRAECAAATKDVQRDVASLREKYDAELEHMRSAAELHLEERLGSLRDLARTREGELHDIKQWYMRVLGEYKRQVSELQRAIKVTQRDYKELMRARREAHAYFTTALRNLRQRFQLYEMERYPTIRLQAAVEDALRRQLASRHAPSPADRDEFAWVQSAVA